MTYPLFTQYRKPAQNSQGIPIVGGDDSDIGSDVGYGQNNDDSSDADFSTGLYGPPAAQAPPEPPSPTAQLTGARQAAPTPPPQLAASAPPSPIAPTRSAYSQPPPIVSQDVQRAIDDRAKMQRPALPKPSIWRQLAATLGETAISGLTGGRKQGQEMAQELGQNIRYGPGAIRDQRQYDQRVADADSQLTAIGKGEDILTRGDERVTNADTRRTNAQTRQAQLAGMQTQRATADLDARLKMQEAVTKSGGRQVASDAAPTPGTIRVPDPMDLDTATGQFKGKTVLEVPEHKGEVQITDETSKVFKLPTGTWIPTKDYADILGKNIEYTNKPPNEAAQKDTQIKADLAAALGVDPSQINDAQMNAARRMFGGEQATAAHLRDFIAKNKRLPDSGEEAAIVDKDFKTAHPGPQQDHGQNVFVNGKMLRIEPGQAVPEGAQTSAGMNASNTPTAQTRTMAEAAPKVIALADRVSALVDQQANSLGPLASRWNEMMAGKVGAPNKEFTQLRTDVALLQTLLMRMHVGARGGEGMMQHFQDLIDAAKQDPVNLRAALGEIREYAKAVAGDHSAVQTSQPAENGAPNKVGDTKPFPNGKIGKWDGHGWVAQ